MRPSRLQVFPPLRRALLPLTRRRRSRDRKSSTAPPLLPSRVLPTQRARRPSAPSQSAPSSPRAAKRRTFIGECAAAGLRPSPLQRSRRPKRRAMRKRRWIASRVRSGARARRSSRTAAFPRQPTRARLRSTCCYATGGYIKSINVGESSGYPALDERALDIARNTRFPNVPQELQSRDFVLRFPIVFRSTAAR